jgi:hypothetical protein
MVMQPLETWRSGVGTQLRRTPLRLLLVAVFPFVVRMLPPCRPWAVHTAVCSLQSAVLEIIVASEPTEGPSASLRSLQGNLKRPK